MADNAIDEAVLECLRHLNRGNRPDVPRTVVLLFIDSVPAILKDLETGLSRNDAGLVSRATHILASSSATVGALSLSECCKALEAKIRAGSILELSEPVMEITRLCREAEAALRVWCSKS